MCNVASGLRLLMVGLLTTILSPVVVKATMTPPEADAKLSPADSTPEAAVPAAQTMRPAANSPIPRVVSVFPADGEENVPSKTTMRIRFDQPMRPGGLSLKWNGFGKGSGFRLNGPVTYDEQAFEFSIPVCLTPAATHEVLLNPDKKNQQFESSRGVPAVLSQWSFRTVIPAGPEEGPQVVDCSPDTDTEIPLVTIIRVRFDQPMDPDLYGVSTDREKPIDRLELIGHITYDPERYEFRIPVGFPPNWSGTLTLRGFYSADGRAAVSKKISYHTLQTLMSDTMQEQIQQAGKSNALLSILKRLQDQYGGIKSARVTATTAMEYHTMEWSSQLDQYEAYFAKQDKKYFGDVSQVMRLSDKFQVGCDGESCWFRRSKEVTVVPVNEVEQQDVSVADGFNASTNRSPEDIVSDYEFEHVGLRTIGGRRYHVLRSWANVKSWWQKTHRVTRFKEWLIDDETALLFQIYSGRVFTTRFLYEAINEDIPASVFAVPAGAGVTVRHAEPLGDGFSRRFLNVSDGTNGRMSLRWGKQGIKGMSSVGLH